MRNFKAEMAAIWDRPPPYTKGPWFAQGAAIYSEDPSKEKPGTPMHHALVGCTGDDGDECEATEQVANARLMAAAPELLEAAQLVIARWSKGDLAEAVRKLGAAAEKAVKGAA